MDFLFTLGFIARVCLGDGLKALPQPFAGGILLGISEELVGLRPNLPAFIISQLLTHLLNQYQQRPPRCFIVFTTLCYSLCSLKNWLSFMLLSEATQNNSSGYQGFSQKGFLSAALK